MNDHTPTIDTRYEQQNTNNNLSTDKVPSHFENEDSLYQMDGMKSAQYSMQNDSAEINLKFLINFQKAQYHEYYKTIIGKYEFPFGPFKDVLKNKFGLKKNEIDCIVEHIVNSKIKRTS